MATDKLIPQYLNLNDDERFIQANEMKYALNVDISSDADGDGGVLKNLKGNTRVNAKSAADALPSSGTNVTIGACSSEAGKCIYYFVYNSQGSHGIYKLDITDDKVYKVFQSSALNFQRESYVKADLLINQQEEHLLYFTDGYNEPMKINATKALLGTTGLLDESDSDKILTYLTVCKQPPMVPATAQFVTDSEVLANRLKSHLFQFAYQYVYEDGEVSAISPYSKLAVASSHLASNILERGFTSKTDNAIDVTLTTSTAAVKKIRVLARKNNEGAFYKVDEVANDAEADTIVIRFSNDGVFPVVPDQEALKPFDAVPRFAQTQLLSNNRLMYGNYVEGFDNHPVAGRAQAIFHQKAALPDVDFSEEAPNQIDFSDDYVQTIWDFHTAFTTTNGIRDDELYPGYLFPGYGYEPTGTIGDHEEYEGNKYTSFADENRQSGFEIDLSGVEDLPPNTELKFFVDVKLDAQRIAINARHEDGFASGVENRQFRTDIKLEHGSFSGGEVDGTIIVCNPKAELQQPLGALSGVDIYTHPSDGTGGNINSLFVTDSTPIEEIVTMNSGDGADGALDLMGNKLAEKLSDRDVIVFVSGNPPTPYRNYFRGTNNNEFIELSFEGKLTFRTTATYDPINKKVFVRFVMEDVDLIMQRGWTRKKVGFGSNDFFPGGDEPAFFYPSHPTKKIIGHIKTSDISQQSGTQKLKDGVDGGNMVYHSMMNPTYSGFVSLSVDSVSRTFKSNSKHSFGVVYFDKNGRHGGVQKLGDLNIPGLTSGVRNGNEGRTEVDLRITSEPPVWASKWAPVYSKNLSYDYYLQTTVAEALLPDKDTFKNVLSPAAVTDDDTNNEFQAIDANAGSSLRSSIFLSMRTLEGKNNSYKEFKGGMLDYQYQEGDLLRVLSYDNGDSEVPSFHEFQITGYHYFQDDKENFLEVIKESTDSDVESVKSANNYRRTGWFLSVRDNDVKGFRRADILAGEDFWSQKCLVEIARPSKELERNLYYEVGKTYDVITASLGGARTHAGDRAVDLSPFSLAPLTKFSFTSDTRLYAGDRISISSTVAVGGTFRIASVTPNGDSGFTYTIIGGGFKTSYLPPSGADYSDAISAGVAEPGSSNPTDGSTTYAGVVTLDCGDAYLRPREVMVNKKEDYTPEGSTLTFSYNPLKADDYDYDSVLVESESASDFFASKASDVGRPHAETPEQERVRRFHSVTYSEAYSPDSARLTLGSFDPSQFPFKDFSAEGGHISHMFDQNDVIILFQEKKVTLVPVSRQLIQTATDGQLVASQEVLGTPNYMAGKFGICRNPQSFAERGGRIFFADVESAKVFEISGKGFKPVSDAKMESHFDKVFSNAVSLTARPKLIGGIDPDNNEYISTLHQVDVEDIHIDGSLFGTIPDAPSGALLDDGKVDVVFSNENGITWNKDCYRYDNDDLTYGPKWNEVGQGRMFLDQLQSKGGVFVTTDFEGESGEKVIDVSVTQNDVEYRGTAKINLTDNTVDFGSKILKCSDGSAKDITIESNTSAQDESTVGYLYDKQVWQSFYSFIPEMYSNLFNDMYSFKDGAIYRHRSNDNRCSFYGTQYGFEFDVISKQNPSMIKVYNAMSVEGNFSNPKVSFSNSYQESGYGSGANHPWEEKEKIKYLPMPKALAGSTDQTDRHAVHLGEVESIDGQVITFTAPINKRPVREGSVLVTLVNDVWTAQAVTLTRTGKKQVTASGDISSLVSVGDDILVGVATVNNGDDVRDYYLKSKVKWGSSIATAESEVYAVNFNFTPSPLHNDDSSPKVKKASNK